MCYLSFLQTHGSLNEVRQKKIFIPLLNDCHVRFTSEIDRTRYDYQMKDSETCWLSREIFQSAYKRLYTTDRL